MTRIALLSEATLLRWKIYVNGKSSGTFSQYSSTLVSSLSESGGQKVRNRRFYIFQIMKNWLQNFLRYERFSLLLMSFYDITWLKSHGTLGETGCKLTLRRLNMFTHANNFWVFEDLHDPRIWPTVTMCNKQNPSGDLINRNRNDARFYSGLLSILVA